MTPALDARGVTVRFGGVVACDGIDLAVATGQIVGLTGPNGSGKSTFLNAVSGLVEATGELTVGGVPLPFGRPVDVARHGVARAFQAPQTWTSLSCLENVVLGSSDRRDHGLTSSLLRRRRMREREQVRWRHAQVMLERTGLGGLTGRAAGSLTYGQRRMLELARSLVGEPDLLLLDEPSAGLNATETAFLAELLTAFRAGGASVLVIDHKIDFLDRISDRIVVLSLGRVIADAPPTEVWSDDAVISAYLGAPRRGSGDGR